MHKRFASKPQDRKRWKWVVFGCILQAIVSLNSVVASEAEHQGEMPPTPIKLVANGQTSAAVVVSADAPQSIRNAVDDLVGYIHESTGATLDIDQASAENRVEIHVGQTEYAQTLELSVADLEVDGFKISFPTSRRIVLLGHSDTATAFAVYEFIERYVGVRWLFPGELGTYVPSAQDITVPAEEVVSQPWFISRTTGGADANAPGEVIYNWLHRHRLHWTIQHHHNLDKLFAPARYLESNPEFFPIVNGQRVVPDAEAQNWQPVLDAPGIVDEAIARITAYFDEHPYSMSYSLGVNDNNFFAHESSYQNSIGLADYSDYYFEFSNTVVSEVLKKHPDKWFGCLAYVGITDPPRSVGVHARIVPHICIDRYGWASEAGAQRDMQRTSDWHAVSPVLGWYDYVYGDDMYRIPRVYPHLMSRYLKYASENGVKAYYSEHYGSRAWIEGPKMYVLMKLLWNPDADVDAMLEEWYTLAVGEHAAVPLAEYYGFWEDYWMQRVPQTDWFEQYVVRQYFDFDKTGYLDELTLADLQHCQRLMDEVVALAETPAQKARAAFFADHFAKLLPDVQYHVALRGQDATEEMIASRILEDTFAPAAGEPTSGPGAERVPSPWGGWQNDPGTARLYWDHSEGFDDSHSLAVDARNAGATVVFYRDFTVDHPQRLHYLEAAVQCTGVNAEANIGIEIRWQRVDGAYLPRKYTGNDFKSARNYRDGEWTKLRAYARPPAEAGPLTMRVFLSGIGAKQGLIRFDDVKLVTINSDVVGCLDVGGID